MAGDQALLIDGMGSVEDAARLRETLVTEWGKRVVFLISTHYFSDHMAAWNLDARRTGAPIGGISIQSCLTPGEHATEFETFFHARNLTSIEARGLFVEAA